MSDKHATVKAQVIDRGASHGPRTCLDDADRRAPTRPARPPRRSGSSSPRPGARWAPPGASTPAIARVQAYLMARQEPLTEREVREALGLSHRAASLALAEAESWGIVERVPEPRRVGRRGPAGTAYLAVGDHWQWFGRVIAERKVREGDPIVAVLEAKEREAAAALAAHPDDPELAALRDWLGGVPRLRPPVRPRRRARPAARAARARAVARAPRPRPRRDDPAPVRPARRARPTRTSSTSSRRCRGSRRPPRDARRS